MEMKHGMRPDRGEVMVNQELRNLLKEMGLLDSGFGVSQMEYLNMLLEGDAEIYNDTDEITAADRLLRAVDARINTLNTGEKLEEPELEELNVLLQLKDSYRASFDEAVAKRDEAGK